jgi:hypothetical protein
MREDAEILVCVIWCWSGVSIQGNSGRSSTAAAIKWSTTSSTGCCVFHTAGRKHSSLRCCIPAFTYTLTSIHMYILRKFWQVQRRWSWSHWCMPTGQVIGAKLRKRVWHTNWTRRTVIGQDMSSTFWVTDSLRRKESIQWVQNWANMYQYRRQLPPPSSMRPET